MLTVKEDAGFGQEGEREEKITISEHDQRACLKEFQKVWLARSLSVRPMRSNSCVLRNSLALARPSRSSCTGSGVRGSPIHHALVRPLVLILLSLTPGFFPPLVIQTVTQPYNVFQSSLAKVTLLGERSWGELRRPWRDAAAFGAQWNSWNDTVTSALTGETPVRVNKKAAKREKAAAKRKSK